MSIFSLAWSRSNLPLSYLLILLVISPALVDLSDVCKACTANCQLRSKLSLSVCVCVCVYISIHQYHIARLVCCIHSRIDKLAQVALLQWTALESGSCAGFNFQQQYRKRPFLFLQLLPTAFWWSHVHFCLRDPKCHPCNCAFKVHIIYLCITHKIKAHQKVR